MREGKWEARFEEPEVALPMHCAAANSAAANRTEGQPVPKLSAICMQVLGMAKS